MTDIHHLNRAEVRRMPGHFTPCETGWWSDIMDDTASALRGCAGVPGRRGRPRHRRPLDHRDRGWTRQVPGDQARRAAADSTVDEPWGHL